MYRTNCPSCGAEVIFQSNQSVYAVCAYCSSMLVRHDVDIENIGKMAALPADMSPFQIGTFGRYRGIGFTLIGRVKLAWQNGVWNEWCVLTDEGERGWLAEAQGTYAMSFERELHSASVQVLTDYIQAFRNYIQNAGKAKPKNISASPVGVGTCLTLNHQQLKIADVKRARCVGTEGELPLTMPPGRSVDYVDLLGAKGEFASVEIADDGYRFYLGRYVEWPDLHCQNTRTLEGWE